MRQQPLVLFSLPLHVCLPKHALPAPTAVLQAVYRLAMYRLNTHPGLLEVSCCGCCVMLWDSCCGRQQHVPEPAGWWKDAFWSARPLPFLCHEARPP